MQNRQDGFGARRDKDRKFRRSNKPANTQHKKYKKVIEKFDFPPDMLEGICLNKIF